MAEPAHPIIDVALAGPPARVRVAPECADPVATNAVGGRPSVVAARTGHHVPSGRPPVMVRRGGIPAEPARGVGAGAVEGRRAHPAFDVAPVTALLLMATQAAGRLRSSLDGMTRHEVTAVDEVPVDGVSATYGHRKGLARVVTLDALRLGMAVAARVAVAVHRETVIPQESEVMPDEGLRRRSAPGVTSMTPGAFLGAKLLVVALETGGHVGVERPLGTIVGNPPMTGDAPSAHLAELEVLRVNEPYGSRPGRGVGESIRLALHGVGRFPVASNAVARRLGG